MAQGQATKVKKKKKSVLKRAAQSLQRAEVNRANRTRVRTMMRRLRTAIAAGDATAAGNLLQPTMSAIDQAIANIVGCRRFPAAVASPRSEEHTSELQSLAYLVCRLLLVKKKKYNYSINRQIHH